MDERQTPSPPRDHAAATAATVRLGCPPYLNSRVLIHGLQADGDGHTLELTRPSVLADRLVAGDVDVGLIPVAEYFRNPQLTMLPDFGIVADGPVDSVKLFARTPLDRLQRVALDSSSRSSAALCKVLLHESCDLAPEYVNIDPQQPHAANADAFLLIGDPCLRYRPQANEQPHDLAQLWRELTGLPFVFAVWTGRDRDKLRRARPLLQQAKAAGWARAEAIARQAAKELGLDPQRAVAYVTRRIGYDLTPRAVQGLRKFGELAARHGLIPEGRELVFLDD